MIKLIEAIQSMPKSDWFWVYFIVVLVELFTGNLKAIIHNDFDSGVSRRGSLNHFGLFLVINMISVVMHIVTGGARIPIEFNMFGFSINLSLTVGALIIIYIIFTVYISSIFENLNALGVPIPKWAKNILRETQEKIIDSEDIEAIRVARPTKAGDKK